jgi:hypothetical protein
MAMSLMAMRMYNCHPVPYWCCSRQSGVRGEGQGMHDTRGS